MAAEINPCTLWIVFGERLCRGGTYALTIFVDRCSVEVFAQDGRATMTELIFPAETSTDLSVYAIGGAAAITSLQVTQLA